MKLAEFLAVALTLPLCLAAESPPHALTARQRIETQHLKAVHATRQQFANDRVDLPNFGVYEDYRAVIHVHAEDSDHTKGTRSEVLAAARKVGVRVVLLTDHRGPKPDTWRGLREGVLFLAGSEDDDGKLRFPTLAPTNDLNFLCHVEERYDADPKGFAGMEICNRHTDAKLNPSLQEHLKVAAGDAQRWNNIVENFKAYPDEMFAAGCDHRAEVFAKWDREIGKRRFTGIGANDAHQNTIMKGVVFDPYEVSFRNLSTHILAREQTEEEVRTALREGHCYVSHDWLCDPTGFAFGAINNLGVFPMGDEVPMVRSTRLVGLTPLPARLKLIHKGEIIAQTNGTNMTFKATEPGAYRLEAWLHVAGEERPWIYSNPVYLKEQSIFSMRLPNSTRSTNVVAVRDLAYREGSSDTKHKLDLYRPREATRAPVFFFVHGGAWRSGDRSLYPPLGYRFANEGILTVIPSYRLAPKNPHPAQIEDVAAAFAWTMRHIADYGGDTNRIYIGGHSAGGHLVALLSLDQRYLAAHHFSPPSIRGVLALSGVYNLDFGDSQSSVFGTDREARRNASPLFHIKNPAPPFLVTYCQWDYPTLPAQAREFHTALGKAGAAAELFFTANENHISEMIAMTYDDDLTAQAIVRFIRRQD